MVRVLVTLQRLLQNAVGSNSEPSHCFQADNVCYIGYVFMAVIKFFQLCFFEG